MKQQSKSYHLQKFYRKKSPLSRFASKEMINYLNNFNMLKRKRFLTHLSSCYRKLTKLCYVSVHCASCHIKLYIVGVSNVLKSVLTIQLCIEVVLVIDIMNNFSLAHPASRARANEKQQPLRKKNHDVIGFSARASSENFLYGVIFSFAKGL